MPLPAPLVFLAPGTARASPVCSHRPCEVLSWVSETLPAVGRCASPQAVCQPSGGRHHALGSPFAGLCALGSGVSRAR